MEPGIVTREKQVMPGATPYNMSAQNYSVAGSIIRQKGCFAFMFTNIGDVVAEVNGIIIFPNIDPITSAPLRGDSVTIGGHKEDIYKGTINLKFQSPTTGTAPLVEIVQLFYSELE